MIIIREKYILILGKGLTQGLDNSTIITDVQYSIDYTESKNVFEVCITKYVTVICRLMV